MLFPHGHIPRLTPRWPPSTDLAKTSWKALDHHTVSMLDSEGRKYTLVIDERREIAVLGFTCWRRGSAFWTGEGVRRFGDCGGIGACCRRDC